MQNNRKSESVIKVFDSIATEYVNYFGDDWEFIEDINSFVAHFQDGATILDLGCGSGYVTNYLFSKNMNAIGIDFSEEMIKIAKSKYPQLKFFIDNFVNIENLFQENSIDGLIALYSLYFVPKEQFEDLLKSFSKVMKNGGKFLFVTQLGSGEDYISTPLMKENDVKDELYVNYYMKDELEEILKRNNFSIDYIVTKYDHDEKEISVSGRYIVLVTNQK